MSGTDATTGRQIDDESHIRQSVRDIVTTPVGSRLMRREYGSLVPELIDQPASGATRLRLMSASIMAILRWEPRVTVQSANFVSNADGSVSLDLSAIRRGGPREGAGVNLMVPVK